MARVIGKPPPSGVAIIVISVDATSLWKASSTRADVWVNVWGGVKYASKVKLWASWFCMDGRDEQAFLRSLDISANLNQEVRDVEEDVVLFQNQFLTCTVILTGDGKGMQAMGGAGSKCWLCKDPNGIVEQRGVESTSRWGSFLRSVTPDRRPGDYQHAACRILNGIAHICWISLWAKIARQKHTMAPSYKQNIAKTGEIHGTVNLRFKRPVHEGYMQHAAS